MKKVLSILRYVNNKKVFVRKTLIMKNYLVYAIIVVLLACNENTPDPPVNPDHRLKFIGIYNMKKLENGQTYSMTIDTVGPYCGNGNNCDSIYISNFCDLFDIRFIQPRTNPDYWFDWPFYELITDKYGHRWQLTGEGNPRAPYYENAIYGDSIKIKFRLNNILYYYADSVPYLFAVYTHVGVRQ